MSVVEASTKSAVCADAAGTGPIGPRAPDTSLRADFLVYLRGLLQDRRVMVGLAAAVLAAAAWFNWGWLVAVGVAPLILAIAPCAAMCALGQCAMGGKKSCGKDAAPLQGAKFRSSATDPDGVA